ncbi:MAG: tetratricopeptide repeat protein [Myxococcota bacterium]|nr:tetratricopeptide repeat protein [Myxococcota bacterium]
MTGRLAGVLHRNLAAALRRGSPAEAEVLLQRLAEEDPVSPQTRGLELEWLVRGERTAEAIALADALAAEFPASPRILLWAGRAAYRARDYGKAAARLAESLRLAPHWTTERWLGKTLTQIGRLDEAEAMLGRLAPQHPECLLDLSWLHERRGEPEQALRCAQEYLASHPGDPHAENRCRRLRAAVAGPGDVIAEVEDLRSLGEPIPEDLLPRYVEALLATGRGAEARERVRDAARGLAPRTATAVGWVAYKLRAWDVAFDLFVAALERNLGDHKFLAAIERAARLCARVEELARAYEAHAARLPALWGRIRRLRGRTTP